MHASWLPDARVAIRTNGRNLAEFDDPDHPAIEFDIFDPVNTRQTTRSAYVEARSGAEFAVHVRIYAEFPHHGMGLQVRVSVDGKQVDSCFTTLADMRRDAEVVVEGTRDEYAGSSYLSKCVFEEHQICKFYLCCCIVGVVWSTGAEFIHIAEEEALDTDNYADLGTIRVELRRYRVLDMLGDSKHLTPFSPVCLGGIPEKAMKGRAISSHTALSQRQQTASVARYSFEYPEGMEPLMTYVFKYRTCSKSALLRTQV